MELCSLLFPSLGICVRKSGKPWTSHFVELFWPCQPCYSKYQHIPLCVCLLKHHLITNKTENSDDFFLFLHDEIMSLIGVCLTFCWLIQFSKILGIWKSSGKTVQLAGPVSSVSLFWEKTIHSRCVDSYCCFLFERMLEFLEQSPGEAQAGTCDAVLVLSAITHGQLSPAASLSLQQPWDVSLLFWRWIGSACWEPVPNPIIIFAMFISTK